MGLEEDGTQFRKEMLWRWTVRKGGTQRHRDAKVADAILCCVNKTRYCQREVVTASPGQGLSPGALWAAQERKSLLQELHSREPQ